MGCGGQGGCERRIEVIMKMIIKRQGGPGVEGGGWEDQCGCEIEVIVKIKKKSGKVRSGVGDQGGCERRIEVIVTLKKKSEGAGAVGGGGWGRRSRWMRTRRIELL